MTAKWFLLIGSVCFWSLGLLTVVKMHSEHDHLETQQVQQQRQIDSANPIRITAPRHDFVELK